VSGSRTNSALRLIVLVVSATIAGSCGGQHESQPSSQSLNVTWILAGDDLAMLRRSNPGLARRFFDNPRTFVIGTEADQNSVPTGYQSVPTVLYSSLATLTRDLDAGNIDRSVDALVYDPEHWAKTPAAEQMAPIQAMNQFVALARSHGYTPIAAPGRDLVLNDRATCHKSAGQLVDQAYLHCQLPKAASNATLVVIQAAPEEDSVPAIRQLLHGVVAQLRGSQPQLITTLSSTSPTPGAQVWPSTLIRATAAELTYADGLMLNFTPQADQLLASYLRDLERLGTIGRYAVPGSGRAPPDPVD
jgi:hypothetical protein